MRRPRRIGLALALAALACGPDREPPAEGSDPAPGRAGGTTPGPVAAAGTAPLGPAPGRNPAAPRGSAPPAAAARLVDEAGARGLDHVNRSGSAAKDFVLEANGAGVAALDLGGDGDLDLVFAQGLGSLAELVDGPGADLELFANDGTGNFTRAPGPGLEGWWTGLAAGDVDGDGRSDLVAGGFGRLVLLLQRADGTLAPEAELLAAGERWVPGAALPPGAPPWVSSLALFDADGDRDLDLFCGLYLEFDPRDPPRGALGEGPLAVPCRWRGHEVFCGPHGLVPQPDRLYLNEGGESHFVERSERLVGLVPAYTLAAASFDADGDGDTDLYTAADSVANSLWIQTPEGLQEVGWSAGVAVSSDGVAEAGMGIAVGDVNGDGRDDLAVTNFSGEPTQLYLGAEFGFDAGTHRYGMQRASRELLSWGAHLADFDLDGWLELFTANGHVYPQADLPDTGTRYGQADSLWRLGPEPRAAAVPPHGPDSLLAPETGSRGSAMGDFDLDGAPDLVVSRIDGPAALGMNRTSPRGGALVLRLVDAAGADVIGARAALVVARDGGEALQSREVRTAEGYQSASSPWLHFGLGPLEGYERIEVRWPGGAHETLPGGPANRMLVAREGRGVIETRELRR